MLRQFDLIVVGSGSGLDVAVAAAGYGLKVAVIEKGPLGGTCLNRGCIPSKMLIHSADVLETINRAQFFGIKIRECEIDYNSIVNRVTNNVDSDSERIETSLKRVKNPLLFKESCKFIGYKTLQVGKDIIKAEKILIASGSRPEIPEIKGLQSSSFITSDEALRLKVQPKVLTIIGGGYIAVKLAHFFGSLGTKVNIVQHHHVLVPKEDEEISRAFTDIFSKKYGVFLGFEPLEVARRGENFEVDIKSEETNQIEVLKSDQLLIATGRIPNSDTLNIEMTGIKKEKNGSILTDEYLETNVEGIFALGDVVGRYPFKHTANLEAEYALNNIINSNDKIPVDYSAMPHAIFTSPQIASVGKTEQQLKAEKTHYLIGRYNYMDTAMGSAIEDRIGFVKILVDGHTRKILGCHIMGTNASILIHEVLVAMKSGDGLIDNIIHTVHIHPALSEIVQRAASNIH